MMKHLSHYMVLVLFVLAMYAGPTTNTEDYFEHPVEWDGQRCSSCHEELLEPFESYTADMRVHYETWSVVVVMWSEGDYCYVSGIEFVGLVSCTHDLGVPTNYFFEIQLGRGNK